MKEEDVSMKYMIARDCKILQVKKRPSRLEVSPSRLEAIASRLEAIAIKVLQVKKRPQSKKEPRGHVAWWFVMVCPSRATLNGLFIGSAPIDGHGESSRGEKMLR